MIVLFFWCIYNDFCGLQLFPNGYLMIPDILQYCLDDLGNFNLFTKSGPVGPVFITRILAKELWRVWAHHWEIFFIFENQAFWTCWKAHLLFLVLCTFIVILFGVVFLFIFDVLFILPFSFISSLSNFRGSHFVNFGKDWHRKMVKIPVNNSSKAWIWMWDLSKTWN